MKTVVATLVAAGVLAGLAGPTATASTRGPNPRPHVAPSVITPQEKRRNEEAYQRGEYYEHDSNALPWGSPSWRAQRQREIGG